MTNNSMEISFSQNSSNSNSTSAWNYSTSSFSQLPHHPPSPTATNHPQENLLLPTPPAKKPRGRPPGSKNKPKTTSHSVPQHIEPSVNLVNINVDSGRDVMESILDIARQGCVSLTVLSASGTVTEVTLCNSPHNTTPFTLHGPFTLLSLNGSYLYNGHYNLHPGPTPPLPLSFGIHLSTTRGQIFCGIISGKVIVGDNVSLTLSTFRNPEIYKHVPEGKERDNNDNNNNPSDSNGGDNQLGFNMDSCRIHEC